MVSVTPHHRPRVRSNPMIKKPVNNEAFKELLAHTRSLTHVEIKLHMDLSNGNPDETWLKTAVRRYEEAANAALHKVLGLDVMTSIPDEVPLLINGTFLLFPKGVQKSVCFVYKLHVDDEYMPKLMEHLPKSNNSLTIKWNIGDGNNTTNIKEFQAKVSLPKTEGRHFVLKGLPHQATKIGVKKFLLQQQIQPKEIRAKGRMEGMANKENFNGANGQSSEWIIKVDYSMKPVSMDFGTYEEKGIEYHATMFPFQNTTDRSTELVQVTYPAAPVSYKNILTNKQTPSPTRTLKIRQDLNQRAATPPPQGKPTPKEKTPTPTRKPNSRPHSPIKTTTAMRTPRSTRKRSKESSTAEEKRTKSPRKLFTETQEQPLQATEQRELNVPPFGTCLDPGPSTQKILFPTGKQHTVETTKENQSAQNHLPTTEQEVLSCDTHIAKPSMTEPKDTQEDQMENNTEEDRAQPTAGKQTEEQNLVSNREIDEPMEQQTYDTITDSQQGCPMSQ